MMPMVNFGESKEVAPWDNGNELVDYPFEDDVDMVEDN